MKKRNYISKIFIDEEGLPAPSPEIRHERDLAIYDILQDNEFSLYDRSGSKIPQGPYVLTLAIRNLFLLLLVEDLDSSKKYEFHLSLTTLRPIINDYFETCIDIHTDFDLYMAEAAIKYFSDTECKKYKFITDYED